MFLLKAGDSLTDVSGNYQRGHGCKTIAASFFKVGQP